jgi:hypothetical protein
MNRKNYVAVAKAIADNRKNTGYPAGSSHLLAFGLSVAVTKAIAEGIADVFEKENSSFDRDMFLRVE